jgi:putative pyruvate formate lyase activating enzyme
LYSKIPHYSTSNQAAVREMHRQVGDLILDDHGLAMHGLLVRHLVLPNNLAGTPEIVRFLAKEISQNTYINLMDQYRPEYQVFTHTGEFPLLNRRITTKEYQEAVKLALAVGLHRLDSH